MRIRLADAERVAPALFLASTWTKPGRGIRLGHLIARWALDHAVHRGYEEVRRGRFAPALVAYYRDVQGPRVLR